MRLVLFTAALCLLSACASASPDAGQAAGANDAIIAPPTPGVAKVSRVEKAFAAADEAQELPPDLAHGKALATRYCGSCHAVDRKGKSQHPKAPAFRVLSQSYPVDALGESLAEGLDAGHPDMPEFMFQPNDIRNFVAYLESIQEKR